jgi:hypothetical protein
VVDELSVVDGAVAPVVVDEPSVVAVVAVVADE